MSENKPKALTFALICVVIWAFIPIVSRFGQQQMDNYQFLFWSSLLSFLVLLGSTFFSGRINTLKNYTRKDVAITFGLGFLGAFIYYLLLYFGYTNAQGLEVLVIQYTWPIFIVIFSFLILGEKITLRNISAVTLGFIGILIVVIKGDLSSIYLNNLVTDLLVLLAAATFGLFSVLSKKVELEPFSATTLLFLSATIYSLVAMLLLSDFTVPAKQELIPVIGNGVIINGFSYLFWSHSLRYAQASFLAPFMFLTPVIASILIVLFFHETFLPVYVVGLALVIGAGIISK